MRVFFWVVLFIAALGALVWAKKHFVDPPKQEEEVVAVHTNSPLPKGLRVSTQPAQPPPAQPADQSPSAPQMSGKDEDNAISNLLHRFTGGGPEKAQDRARVRMKAFMQAWKEGGTSLNDAEQAASCLWARGKILIPDRDEIRDAYNGFIDFRRQKNLYTTITDYSIGETSSVAHDEVHGDYTVFDVTINNFPYEIGVPDKPNPMFWIR